MNLTKFGQYIFCRCKEIYYTYMCFSSQFVRLTFVLNKYNTVDVSYDKYFHTN